MRGLSGLADKARFKVGDLMNLPVEDGTIDVIWTEFVSMNIADKPRMYREFQRVLCPGGRVALHELQRNSEEPAYYPAFWADDPTLSFLHTPAEIKQMLIASGFKERDWHNYTRDALEWWERVRVKGQANPLGLNVIVADNVPEKAKNLHRSLQDGRTVAVKAVFERVQ